MTVSGGVMHSEHGGHWATGPEVADWPRLADDPDWTAPDEG